MVNSIQNGIVLEETMKIKCLENWKINVENLPINSRGEIRRSEIS